MISLILAVDDQLGIGKNGNLPWKISQDMKYFKKTTVGNGRNVVVMGRKTWESIGLKPLKERINFVLTTQKVVSTDDNVVFGTLLDFQSSYTDYKAGDIFIIGGEKVYRQFFTKCDCIYVTRVHGIYD